jgi:Permuted papain-like amidase enzyme, YaeF/YiiX, C92 family
MGKLFDAIGLAIARYLETPDADYAPGTLAESAAFRACLQPGDVLLVEGASSISCIIKYLTQSTWSHAALYVGPIADKFTADGEPHVLIEANVGEGVVTAPLSKYSNYPTRVCRPIGLKEADRQRVCRHVIERVGLAYDVKNITDLLRYLLPAPGSRRWRRRMTKLGSGDPGRIICSALIAQAFQAVHYPILAKASQDDGHAARRQIPEMRDPTLYAPRDFDVSPYFTVVKPAIENGFDYEALNSTDLPPAPAEATPQTIARSPMSIAA